MITDSTERPALSVSELPALFESTFDKLLRNSIGFGNLLEANLLAFKLNDWDNKAH